MLIYKITNKINGKIYVGYSSQTLEKRIKKYHQHIKQSNHQNRPIIRALKKYGFESFSWSIIDNAADKQEMCDKEIFWIAFLESTVPSIGYNISTGGEGGNVGRNFTKEHCDKIGEAHKGMRHTKESLKKISNAAKNRIVSEETKKKMSESHKGKNTWSKGKTASGTAILR